MTDLKQHLRDIEAIVEPNLWPEIQSRAGGSMANEARTVIASPAKRLRAGLVAAAVFILAGVYAWNALRPSTGLPLLAGTPSPPGDGTTYRIVAHGLSLTYPDGWTPASETLTPALTDPREILALGTYPLRPGGPNCAQFPVNAIVDLGPMDGLIWLAERGTASGTLPPRPDTFESIAKQAGGGDESSACLPTPKDFNHYIAQFSYAGRDFEVYVAYGNYASSTTVSQLWAILDGMRLSPASVTGAIRSFVP